MSYEKLAMRTNSHSFYPYVFKNSFLTDLRSAIESSKEMDGHKRVIFYSGQAEGHHDAGSSRFLSPDFAEDPKVAIEIIHSIVGILTESGELAEALEAAITEKKINRTNIIEEMGDLLWYIALLCNAMHTTIEEVGAINIGKLAVRYPEKFDPERAHERDLVAEEKMLKRATLDELLEEAANDNSPKVRLTDDIIESFG